MTTPGQQLDANTDALALLQAKVQSLALQVAQDGQRIDQNVADISDAELRLDNLEVGEVLPPSPLPEPPVVEPEPTPPPVDTPTPPAADKVLELGPGRHDLKGRVSSTSGFVTKIVGPPDAIITKIGSIRGGSVIIEGPSTNPGPYKLVEGDGTGEAWLINPNFTGQKINPDYLGGELTWAPTWGFRRNVYIGGTIRQVQRGTRGYTEIYNTHYEDVYEDLIQGHGILRNVTAARVGWPYRKQGSHPDIIQAFSKIDVDGLNVTDYYGQGFALGDPAASGSTFRNVSLSQSREPEGKFFYGASIETSTGSGGPNRLAFHNVQCDKPWFVRRDGSKAWQGEGITVTDSKFSNKEGSWTE